MKASDTPYSDDIRVLIETLNDAVRKTCEMLTDFRGFLQEFKAAARQAAVRAVADVSPAESECGPASPSETAPLELEPRMEMYGVPMPEIVDLVRVNGGRIVEIGNDHSAGPEWVSYFYYITKP